MFKRKSSHRNDTIAALDIGSTRVSCVIARLHEDKKSFELIGTGQHMTQGLRRGVIIDMESVSDAIAHAVQNAEHQADLKIHKVYVGVPATVIHAHVVQWGASLDEESPVGHEDIEAIFQGIHGQEYQQARKVLHVIPLSYELDEQKGIQDPRGMYGKQLQVRAHVLSVPVNILRNFLACVEGSHLEVAGFVAIPHATALATLVEDEMTLGATLIDVGGGSVSMISYMQGRPTFLTAMSIGGWHVTQDIARVFSTPLLQAERLKTLYGSAIPLIREEREPIPIVQIGEEGGAGNTMISKGQLNQIIQSRLEETFLYFKNQLEQQPDHVLQARIVLAGGGSQMSGLREFIAQMMKRHVRLGQVSLSDREGQGLLLSGGISMTTCVGILKYVMQESHVPSGARSPQEMKGFMGRLKRLFEHNV